MLHILIMITSLLYLPLVGRQAYVATDITVPVTNFDTVEDQYHTVTDYLALIGSPAMDAFMGSSGQPIVQDHGLTPGAVRTTDSTEVCSQRTETIRNVPEEEKKAVYEAYQRYYPVIQYITSNYEVDHLVSLELGGSNSPRNLWPEYYNDPYGARTKDKLENLLHKQVCSGKMTLQQAQYIIAMDWRNAYYQYFGKVQ